MIKKTVGKSYQTDGDDVLALKTKLNELGLYKIPDHGITPYADQALFNAIGDFQKSHDLPATKVIRPGDATAKILSNLSGNEDVPDGDEDLGNSPIYRCPTCGAPHGGSGEDDDRCPDCRVKG